MTDVTSARGNEDKKRRREDAAPNSRRLLFRRFLSSYLLLILCSKKMNRHQQTIETMIGIYCRGNHRTQEDFCNDCAELLSYAEQRLARCPFLPKKPPCSKCPVHCYKPAMREKIRQVMRYAGPRMLGKHPVMAMRHLIEGLRKPPLG
ncbi:nitrous oxide-stimulated promoter family protein [Planctomycetota bacterium]